MNPWNSFLESMHSALIDELVLRHPEPKPELGLPIRRTDLTPPAEASFQEHLVEVHLGQGCGDIVIALDAEAQNRLRCTPQALFEAALEHARTEFARRGIAPRFETGDAKTRDAATRQTIWFPFGLADAKCFLGISVRSG